MYSSTLPEGVNSRRLSVFDLLRRPRESGTLRKIDFRCDRILQAPNTIGAKIPNLKLLETTENPPLGVEV